MMLWCRSVIIKAALGAVLLTVLMGCSRSSAPNNPDRHSTGTELDSTVNGRMLTYPSNQRFSLELDVNADAGYQWDYLLSDTTVVRIDSINYRPKNGSWNIVGGLTVETIYFRTLHKGISAVDLIEHQIWLPRDPPIHMVRFFVTVN